MKATLKNVIEPCTIVLSVMEKRSGSQLDSNVQYPNPFNVDDVRYISSIVMFEKDVSQIFVRVIGSDSFIG